MEEYVKVFSVWNEDGNCLSWEDTEKFCKERGLETVQVSYKGPYNTQLIKEIAEKTVTDGQKGIIVRISNGFNINSFSNNIAKYVRKNHVQTKEHWQYSKIEKNSLLKANN